MAVDSFYFIGASDFYIETTSHYKIYASHNVSYHVLNGRTQCKNFEFHVKIFS